MINKIANFRNRNFLLIDIIIFLLSPLIALFLRLDGAIQLSKYCPDFILMVILFTSVKFVIIFSMGVYRRMWKHAGVDELALILIAISSAGIINALINSLLRGLGFFEIIPRSIVYLDAIVSLILFGASRMAIRLTIRANTRSNSHKLNNRTLIIGAGQAGISLAKDMQATPELGYDPVAFIDDNPEKIGLRVIGISVAGNHSQIKEVIIRYNIKTIIIAIPSASGENLRSIITECKNTGVKVKTIPSLSEIIDGKVNVNSIREIDINDLLRREPIQTDCENVSRYINGKVALITGAGGSIGSELCRQIIKYSPKEIILLGRGENSIFKIQQELLSLTYDNVKITAIIADIKDKPRLNIIFRKYYPDIVFHAAAHKHVPLMEANPYEAIKNNIFGTKNVLDCAEDINVEKLVMISTDKAVNPTNVMGVCKRIAETLVIKRAKENGLPYSCVRFGNVLGSNGSVVPTFKKQIAKGGPITVTHPEVKRFFMTIPEAVQLVLQAANIGIGGDIFVLNMGEPIKIVDLAKDLIRLSGLKEKDIEIIFTGLRPGEKLFEELFIKGEKYENTIHSKIFIAKNASNKIPETINNIDRFLSSNLEKAEHKKIRAILKTIINEYKPMI